MCERDQSDLRQVSAWENTSAIYNVLIAIRKNISIVLKDSLKIWNLCCN